MSSDRSNDDYVFLGSFQVMHVIEMKSPPLLF